MATSPEMMGEWGASRKIKLILVDDKMMPFLFTFQHLGTRYATLIFSYSLPNTRDEVTEKWVCVRSLFVQFVASPLN